MRLRLGEVPGVVVPKALHCRLEKVVAAARLKLGAQARKNQVPILWIQACGVPLALLHPPFLRLGVILL